MEDNEIWFRLCERDWATTDLSNHNTFLSLYKYWYSDWKKYISCYSQIKTGWNRLEKWFSQHESLIHSTLNPGETELALNEAERIMKRKLPLQLRCSLRLHNGQSINYLVDHLPFGGLFGGYQSGERVIEISPMNVQDITKNFHLNIPALVPFAWAGPQKTISVDVHTNEIFFHTASLLKFVTPQTTLAMFLHNYADQLYAKNFIVHPHSRISLFPRKEMVVQETKGIQVSVIWLHAPEWSTITLTVFLYRVEITVPKSKTEEYVLTSSLWMREDSKGNLSEIPTDGCGDGSEYLPILSPGVPFQFTRSVQFPTLKGEMWGFLMFKTLEFGLLSVAVPRFSLTAPQMIDVDASLLLAHRRWVPK